MPEAKINEEDDKGIYAPQAIREMSVHVNIFLESICIITQDKILQQSFSFSYCLICLYFQKNYEVCGIKTYSYGKDVQLLSQTTILPTLDGLIMMSAFDVR